MIRAHIDHQGDSQAGVYSVRYVYRNSTARLASPSSELFCYGEGDDYPDQEAAAKAVLLFYKGVSEGMVKLAGVLDFEAPNVTLETLTGETP